ncbi:hypothetical protein [Rhizobium lusitanum]|nr:hypothetical protein [Rhizobium lusitanum]
MAFDECLIGIEARNLNAINGCGGAIPVFWKVCINIVHDHYLLLE